MDTVDSTPSPCSVNGELGEQGIVGINKPFLSRKAKSFSGPEMNPSLPPVTLALETESSPLSMIGIKWNRARNRKKSRRMTLLQACAESVDGQIEEPTVAKPPDTTTDDPITDPNNVSRSQNSVCAERIPSTPVIQEQKEQKERKISRIYWMLQSMQQAFIHPNNQENPVKPGVVHTAVAPPMPTNATAYPPVSSHAQLTKSAENGPKISGSFRAVPPHLRYLQGLGQSQESMVISTHPDMPMKNPIRDRLARFGSINSWTGSEFSESSLLSSSTASSAPPPLIHPVPYHKDGCTSLFIVASSTYAQLLVVVCLVSVFAEVVTSHVPVLYSEGFFTYLYTGSLLFFLYVFGYLMRSKRRKAMKEKQKKINRWRRRPPATAAIDMDTTKVHLETISSDDVVHGNSIVLTPSTFDAQSLDESRQRGSISIGNSTIANHLQRKSKKMKVSESEHSHGSFFLRAGAVAFGLGTMIYDGLEFGAFMEIPSDSPCYALLRGVNPVLHAVFVFFQMYFVFVSARLNIHKFKAIARFGLMHCLATNVCVWIRTLVRESLKEINEHAHHHADKSSSGQPHYGGDHHHSADNASTYVPGSHLWELTGNVSCGHNVFLGDVIMKASPFLYPFIIEYSLIGAAVLYVLWAHIGLNPKYVTEGSDMERPRSKSHLRVDCLGSSKGLFIGLLLLAVSLLCLVLFFVFANQPDLRWLGLILADGAHCTLLLVSLVAMAIGANRARRLTFHAEHPEECGEMLLRVSALGIFAYSVFSMIAGALGPVTEEPPLLVLVNGLLSLLQVTVQMLFISDMSRRRVSNPEDDRLKPGRQTVTFLLITNITLWLVYTFEMQKVESNPVQMSFYGFLPWAVVQRITLPLCIFYRFHSSCTLAEIWKNTYRYH